MIVGTNIQRRNRRLALVLFGVFAFMCVGSVLYINWYDAPRVNPAAERTQ